MKKAIFLLMSVLAVIVSCERFDDSSIWEELKNHDERITRLEELCKEMNSNISSLQIIVKALQENDYVTNVVTVVENGEEVGYTISFSKSGSITIYHGKNGKDGQDGAPGKDGEDGAPGQDGTPGQDGKDGHTPVIGVRKDADGIYYWTLDGEWLLDDEGQKIPTTGKDGQDGVPGEDGEQGEQGEQGIPGQDGRPGQDGVTPLLKIEEDYWYVSYDNGVTWERLYKAVGEDGKDGAPGKDGKDGDSMFSNIDITNSDYIIFTLSDGSTIKIPTWKAFEELQTLVNKINTNVNSLQKVVEALQKNDYVTSVLPLTENGVVIGYTITFSKSGTIIIYHGKDGAPGKDGQTPVIGVKLLLM